LFTRKVAHLAHIRITELVNELNNSSEIKINPSVIRQIEYTFMYIMIKTLLLQNRHIDQLLMCVIYSVCKINVITVSFKQIVEAYIRCIPHSNSQIFRMVKLKEEKGDIIKFYNMIFLEEMEIFIYQLGVAEDQSEESPHPRTSSINLRICSPLRLQKSPQTIRNLTVSPRRTPLLFKEEGSSLILGSLKSPQSEFDKINHFISNRSPTTTPKTKRKLDYGSDDNPVSAQNPVRPPPSITNIKQSSFTVPIPFLQSPLSVTKVVPKPVPTKEEDEEEEEEENDDIEEDEEGSS